MVKNKRLLITLLVLLIMSLAVLLVINDQTVTAQLAVPEEQTSKYDGGLAGNPIIEWIEFFINVLTVVIVAGAAVMIAVAGIEYLSARDNSQNVQSAKNRIFNTFLGLVAYLFLYAFVQWLIPGGVF